MDVLKQQYELLKGSRGVMLDFIESNIRADITKPLPEFNGSTVRYLLVHTANTYKHWLGNVAMQQGLAFTDEKLVSDMPAVRGLYDETNELVNHFFTRFEGRENEQFVHEARGHRLALTPLQLFTHTLTHEFHHKGQIMTMCRLLGYTPPDTDIIRF